MNNRVDYEFYMGIKKNRFTVLDIIWKYNRTYFKCQCDCGNIKDVKMSHFNSGRTKSCGCFLVEMMKKRKGIVSKLLRPNNISAKRRLYKKYEKEAEKRNLIFELSLDYFIELTEKRCFYCNDIPKYTIYARGSRSIHIYNGIDRQNNNIGYTLENSVTCCKQCNLAKRDNSIEDFTKWIEKIYSFYIKKE